MTRISQRRITRELNEYRELARDIVRPPLGGWSYVRSTSNLHGNVHFVMGGEEFTAFDLVKKVVQPLQPEDIEPFRFPIQLRILTSVVRSEVECDIARTRIEADLYGAERREG